MLVDYDNSTSRTRISSDQPFIFGQCCYFWRSNTTTIVVPQYIFYIFTDASKKMSKPQLIFNCSSCTCAHKQLLTLSIRCRRTRVCRWSRISLDKRLIFACLYMPPPLSGWSAQTSCFAFPSMRWWMTSPRRCIIRDEPAVERSCRDMSGLHSLYFQGDNTCFKSIVHVIDTECD